MNNMNNMNNNNRNAVDKLIAKDITRKPRYNKNNRFNKKHTTQSAEFVKPLKHRAIILTYCFISLLFLFINTIFVAHSFTFEDSAILIGLITSYAITFTLFQVASFLQTKLMLKSKRFADNTTVMVVISGYTLIASSILLNAKYFVINGSMSTINKITMMGGGILAIIAFALLFIVSIRYLSTKSK